ncbi:NCS2 family permease [bacterium]|nr:NCS2 family permease [bacterium]
MLERIFKVRERGSTVGREVLGGATTFFTMSYIIFVQPAVLAQCGMDFGAVMVATILSSALATVVMAFAANYPIALAPAMGHNFFFVFTVCGAVAAGGLGLTWQQGLAATVISGAIFILLSKAGFRSALMNSVPASLKQGISAGIGLFIALIGLEYAHLVVAAPGTLVSLGKVTDPVAALALFGILVTLMLMALRVHGALLLGMLATLGLSLLLGLVKFHGVFSAPPSLAPTFFALDFPGLFSINFLELVTVIFVILFMDLFDTVGTVIGVGTRAGWIKDGKMPRGEQVLFSDAVGTVAGACLGTSTVTSYIESATGVAAGAKTGLANLVTAALFLLALFFAPLAKMIGGGIEVAPQVFKYPIIAPALIIVGALMMQSLRDIEWDDATEGIPAFLTLTIMPFTFSIANGIAFGFVSYAAAKALSGRWRECPVIVYIFAVLFVIEYTVMKT